jgi:hypothetical protein
LACTVRGHGGSALSIAGLAGMDLGDFKHGSELKGFIGLGNFVGLVGVLIGSVIKSMRVRGIKYFWWK